MRDITVNDLLKVFDGPHIDDDILRCSRKLSSTSFINSAKMRSALVVAPLPASWLR